MKTLQSKLSELHVCKLPDSALRGGRVENNVVCVAYVRVGGVPVVRVGETLPPAWSPQRGGQDLRCLCSQSELTSV